MPVIPSFITMEETDRKDADGANVLACRITFLPAIYPKQDASEKDNAEYLKDENYKAWKDLYENTYHKESKRPAFLQWEKHKKSKLFPI